MPWKGEADFNNRKIQSVCVKLMELSDDSTDRIAKITL